LIRKWVRPGVIEDGVTISTATGVLQGGAISPLLSQHRRTRPGHPLGERGEPPRHERPIRGRCGDHGSVRGRRAESLPMSPGESLGPEAGPASGQDPDHGSSRRGGRLRLSGVSPALGEVAEVREMALPALALGPRHGQYQDQGQGDHGPALPAETLQGGLGGGAQSSAEGLAQLLPVGQFLPEVLLDRQLCPGAAGTLRQQEAPEARTPMGHRPRPRLVRRASRAAPLWNGSRCSDRDRDPVNTVGEPDDGKPQVRFDEGRLGRLRLSQPPTLPRGALVPPVHLQSHRVDLRWGAGQGPCHQAYAGP